MLGCACFTLRAVLLGTELDDYGFWLADYALALRLQEEEDASIAYTAAAIPSAAVVADDDAEEDAGAFPVTRALSSLCCLFVLFVFLLHSFTQQRS